MGGIINIVFMVYVDDLDVVNEVFDKFEVKNLII